MSETISTAPGDPVGNSPSGTEGATPASSVATATVIEGVLHRIRYRPGGYRQAEGLIAAAIVADPGRFTRESIVSFASRTQVSTGSVSRFARLAGFAGIRDLKLALARELPAAPAGVDSSARSPFAQAIEHQVRALLFLASEVDEAQFHRAAQALHQARAVDLIAVGASAAIAQSLLFSFTQMGIRARFLTDPTEQLAAAAFNTPDDVVLAISFSGRTRTAVDAAARAAESGAAVIAMTCNQRAPLVAHAKVALVADVRRSSIGQAEWPFRTALFGLARALVLEVSRLQPADERRRHRQTWASGRFAIRYNDE